MSVSERELSYDFYEKMKQQPDCTKFWDRGNVKAAIECLKNSNTSLPTENDFLPGFIRSTFCVAVNNNRDVLMRKVGKYDIFNKYLEVLPWEDAFHAIWSTHIETSHGTLVEVARLIFLKKYFVDVNVIKIALKLCPVCEENSTNLIFNYKCGMQVLTMPNPYDNFRCVLVYEDLHTGYIQLKPMMKDNVNDIAFELFKIFSDFGQPKMLHVNSTYNTYLGQFSNILQNTMNCTYQVKYRDFDKRWLTHISMLLQNHEHHTIADLKVNWVAACNLLQWKINNESIGIAPPHTLVFGDRSLLYAAPIMSQQVTYLNPSQPSSSSGVKAAQKEEQGTGDLSSIRIVDVRSTADL